MPFPCVCHYINVMRSKTEALPATGPPFSESGKWASRTIILLNMVYNSHFLYNENLSKSRGRGREIFAIVESNMGGIPCHGNDDRGKEGEAMRRAKRDGLADHFIYGSVSPDHLAATMDTL